MIQKSENVKTLQYRGTQVRQDSTPAPLEDPHLTLPAESHAPAIPAAPEAQRRAYRQNSARRFTGGEGCACEADTTEIARGCDEVQLEWYDVRVDDTLELVADGSTPVDARVLCGMHSAQAEISNRT